MLPLFYEEMDDPEENLHAFSAPSTVGSFPVTIESPLGKSRYGRTRKPKISADFCSIDEAIGEDTEIETIKPIKSPIKTPNKTKITHSVLNGIHPPLKQYINRINRQVSYNNNNEIAHVTGDSDMGGAFSYRQNEKTQRPQDKARLLSPLAHNISVSKEKISKIRNKELSEELKPILSEDIFQKSPVAPSINVAEVFKIISSKTSSLDLNLTPKQTPKGSLKTYINKRKSFQKTSPLIESFGLPDEPIVPIENDKFIKPLRISEIDVDIVKPEAVNLVDKDLIDSLWKISSIDDEYDYRDDHKIVNIPVFDVRGRFTPDKEYHCQLNQRRNPIAKKILADPLKLNDDNKDAVLICTNEIENVMPKFTEEVEEKKMTVMKKIITSDDIKLKAIDNLSQSLEFQKPNIIVKSKSKNCDTERAKVVPLKNEISNINGQKTLPQADQKDPLMIVCDIEDHIKISMIDKEIDVVETVESDKPVNKIDINVLKDQISARIKFMKTEEEDSPNVKLPQRRKTIRKKITESPKGDEGKSPDSSIDEIKTHPESKTVVIKSDLDLEEITDTCLDEKQLKMTVEKVEDITSDFDDQAKDPLDASDSIVKTPTQQCTESSCYYLGDLMWAKVGGHPYWPCMISKEPQTNTYCKIKYRNVPNYHVRFFGDNGRRSWISSKHLLPYSIDINCVKRKGETIVPHENSKIYVRWREAVAEAETLKDKKKEDKFKFFKEILSSRRPAQRKQRKEMDKLSVQMKATTSKTVKKRLINQPIGTGKLYKELIAAVKLEEAKNLKMTTRSSSHSSPKKSLRNSRNFEDTEPLDDDLRKQETHLSDGESTDNVTTSLTSESQISLFKRNNLFKGVSRERVCQICEKPNEVIKCKGRCNGYYHVLCASRMDISDNQEYIIGAVGDDMNYMMNKNDERKPTDDAQKDCIENTIVNCILNNQDDESVTEEAKDPLDLENHSETDLDVVFVDISNKKQENDQRSSREESKSCKNRRFKNPLRHSDLCNPEYRRVTRSQSQEREMVQIKSDASGDFDQNQSDLSEVEITAFPIDAVKEERVCEQKLCAVKEEIRECDPVKKREKRRVTRSSVVNHISESESNVIVKIEEKSEVLNPFALSRSKTEYMRNCNVKIVNIRKKSGSLYQPPLISEVELGKLSLNDNIDKKMNEIMQIVEKKSCADSTTDYTSSEESAIDLLSPKGRKLINASKLVKHDEMQDNSRLRSPLDDDADKRARVLKISKNEQPQIDLDFKCAECLEDLDHDCFVCHKKISDKASVIRQKCSIFPCGKFYHPECLKVWPQTQWSVISTTKHKQSNESLYTFVCPVHVCHTCVSDDPRAAIPRCTSDKVVKCLRCPATYHNSAYCIPAGTKILSSTQIVCPRHFVPKRVTKKALPIINTTWCFICSEGGDLICCETCPTSVHTECLKINITEEDKFICEDCETGRFPLYDEIVWVKLGHYRWWPALILFPNEVPPKIRAIKHTYGEFVVRFFGTHDHYWVGRGRVFLFQEGDAGEPTLASSRKRTDVIFKRSIEEATEAHRIKKEFKQNVIEEAAIKLKYKPPHYIKIKVNRPVGNVRQFDGNISNTTPCECDPKSENPCGIDSDCLNRLLLTECNPEVCPAGEKCQNQHFEQRNYPQVVPYRTESRGWGLKSLEPIKKGAFVIEYVGEMIDEKEYQRRIKKMHEQKEENYYFLTIDKDRMLDAGPKGNVARFMNHSCQPNCETQKWTVNGDTRVGLFAVNDVAANTELTFNYNLECVGKERKMCKCGAPNCSGFIGLKAKQEESRKSTKSKLRSKRKKGSQLPQLAIVQRPCFVCGNNGDVISCNNKICTKSYHLECVKLDAQPDNKWACPWHNCNICMKRTIRCCVKCLNSYCPVHSEGSVRYDKLLGFLCAEHDPMKVVPQETPLEDIIAKDDPLSQAVTDGSDVTSSSSVNITGAPTVNCQTTPKKSSPVNMDIVTSTPIKLQIEEVRNVSTEPDQTTPESARVSTEAKVPRKRGRPKNATKNGKKPKLDTDPNTLPISVDSSPARNLRTNRVVNYNGAKKYKKINTVGKSGTDTSMKKRSSKC